MKAAALILALSVVSSAQAFAQSSVGNSSNSTGAAAAAGSTLSNGTTLSGTEGSPGPNAANALNRGKTGNNIRASQTSAAGAVPASHGNAVNTPAANAATQNLGNTDAGVLKK